MSYALAYPKYFVGAASRQKTIDFAYSAQHSVYTTGCFSLVRFARPLAWLIVEWQKREANRLFRSIAAASGNERLITSCF
jgi:hypothetical protein